MTAVDSVPFAAVLEENLASASPDMLRAMVAMFAGQSDEWTEQRRYIGAEILERCRKTGTAHTIEGNQSPETARVPLTA